MLGDNKHAFKLAKQIRSDFPNSDLGTATWVRNAPEHKSFEKIEKDIAPHLRKGIETAFALSWRALKAGELPKAEEYGRAALADGETSPLLLENLGIVLLEASQAEAVAQYAVR